MKLSEWMAIKGWKETDLARELGVSRQAVNYWMRGGRVRPDNAEKIEKITHGDVTYRELTSGRVA